MTVMSRWLTVIPYKSLQWLMPLLVMCLIFVIWVLTIPDYVGSVNVQQLMRDFAAPGLVAVAMALVIFSGGIDLSVGATFALSNFAALYFFRVLEWPLGLAVPATLVVGAVIGAINGYLIAYLNARAFLTTLAMLLILRAAYELIIAAYTLELATAMHTNPVWEFLGTGTLLAVPVNMIVLIAVVGVLHVFLTRIRPGVHIMATGAGRRAARHVGIDVKRSQFFAYVLAGIVVSLAGLFYAARQNSAGSDSGYGWELSALTAVVLGGIPLEGGHGRVIQALIGAAILFLLVSGLLRLNMPGSLTMAVIGLVLIIAVATGMQTAKHQSRTNGTE